MPSRARDTIKGKLMANSAFSRQLQVKDWHQPLISQQIALVLGVGGIGCHVCVHLCRLGVKKIILLDNDVVDLTNLNRQLLFSQDDVGRRKVDAAMDGLKHHTIGIELLPYHCDAVEHWDTIVQLAQQATVVFNCIDYGEYFDYAVMSLCTSLSLSYITASSFGHTAIAECYPTLTVPQKGPCWACNNCPAEHDLLQQITPDKIQTLKSISFLPKDTRMPVTQEIGSSILSCGTASQLATTTFINSLHGFPTPHWTQLVLCNLEMFSYSVEVSPTCLICSNAPKYSAHTVAVYFGISMVTMSPAEGSSHPYHSSCVSNPGSHELISAAKSRYSPTKTTKCDKILLPALPIADLQVKVPDKDTVQPLPEIISVPLIKTQSGSYTVLRSGQRSAIIPTTSGCYRLKGCGHYLDDDDLELRLPYPSFSVSKIDGCDASEIRGCSFPHTSVNELYMCDLVRQSLNDINCSVGNSPLGMWQYNIKEDEFPEILKTCTIFETIGEKRVANHLLSGVELLLPMLFPALEPNDIIDLFAADRLVQNDTGSLSVVPTWQACCCKHSAPVNLCAVTKLHEQGPDTVPVGIPNQLVGEWCRSAYRLRECLPITEPNSKSLCALLYWRVGRETGSIARCLKKQGINWGYFIDHNQALPHCNAHPNNLILVAPNKDSGERLLAPVDFDFSFTREGFFSPYTGEPDDALFSSWMETGGEEMERALGGDVANTGVDEERDTPLTGSYDALRWGLRDTLLCGYRSGLADEEDEWPSDKFTTALNDLVHLALIITSNRNV